MSKPTASGSAPSVEARGKPRKANTKKRRTRTLDRPTGAARRKALAKERPGWLMPLVVFVIAAVALMLAYVAAKGRGGVH